MPHSALPAHAHTSFAARFTSATGTIPYRYHQRLACGSDMSSDRCPCESLLINIPTGLGKALSI
jgi:hypothetical protein